tara:strand:- start:384 stop:632 length:249 start_codon:yes stop_codon:yes gene_type:complete
MNKEMQDINMNLINEMRVQGGIMRIQAQRLLEAYHKNLKDQRAQCKKELNVLRSKRYKFKNEMQRKKMQKDADDNLLRRTVV